MRMFLFSMVVVMAMGRCWGAEVTEELLDALTITESSVSAPADLVGDRELFYKAYGPLQIRKPYLDDVNRIAGREAIEESWGKKSLTTADMKDVNKARWAARIYLEYYGRVYEKETGKKPTDQIYARMHNGGPQGWKRHVTRNYWAKASVTLRNVRYILQKEQEEEG
jgi:hypothetical protein